VPDVKEVYELVTQQTPPKADALERQRKRQTRHTMNQKLGAFAVVAAIVGLAFLAVRASVGDGGLRPAGPGPSVRVPGEPKVDYLMDLNTGAKTPLPEAIVRSLASLGTDRPLCSLQVREVCLPQYAASPDGSLLAYVGAGKEGTPQIFIAGIDGTGARQVTHDPTGAASPAWSPDGTKVAYEGYASGDVRNLFVLDLTTGKSKVVIDDSLPCPSCVRSPQFTPDGSAILFTGGTNQVPVLRTVPVDGGKSSLLFRLSGWLEDAGNGSLSPDGSLVTFLGGGTPTSGTPDHCGPCRLVARADGTEIRVIPGFVSNPAGTWSPDGKRIVCSDYDGRIIVVDVATGDASPVAEGSGASWLDDHTLLIEV
jgi:WD40 repeat protein